jgi:hypothetical protein
MYRKSCQLLWATTNHFAAANTPRNGSGSVASGLTLRSIAGARFCVLCTLPPVREFYRFIADCSSAGTVSRRPSVATVPATRRRRLGVWDHLLVKAQGPCNLGGSLPAARVISLLSRFGKVPTVPRAGARLSSSRRQPQTVLC